MADAEGVVGELTHQHGLDHARSRGTPLFHVQLLLGCSALNLKRVATHAGQAASGAAAGPNTGQATTLDAAADAPRRTRDVHWHSITQAHTSRRPASRLDIPTWTLSISLN